MNVYEGFMAFPSVKMVSGMVRPNQERIQEQQTQKKPKQESDEFDKLFQQACKIYV
ncbi:MAG: hypothetical protein IJ567_05860 [Lachnospiraceae bacterium]|nr:hypothetical protein [Lachnospiraceae bacterium]